MVESKIGVEGGRRRWMGRGSNLQGMLALLALLFDKYITLALDL